MTFLTLPHNEGSKIFTIRMFLEVKLYALDRGLSRLQVQIC